MAYFSFVEIKNKAKWGIPPPEENKTMLEKKKRILENEL